MKLIKLENVEGEFKVDSRIIAEKLGIENRAVVQMARRHFAMLETYGKVTFQMRPSINSATGQKVEVCFLNMDQSTFLVTLSKNSIKAVELKKQLTDSYIALKKQVMEGFNLPKTYGEALQLAADQAKQIEEQTKQIESDRPRVGFSKSIEASSQSIKIGNFAKVISKEDGLTIGRNRLFAWLRNQKILQADNIPYQRYIDNGWFEVKESAYLNADEVNLGFTTLVTGNGQVKLLKRIKDHYLL